MVGKTFSDLSLRLAEAPFLGRVDELAELKQCWERSRSAQQHLVLVGPVGMGKSTLARHFALQVEREGGSTVWLSLDHVGVSWASLVESCKQQGLFDWEQLGRGDQPHLLVLDGLDASPGLLALVHKEIQKAADTNLMVLVTSRVPLPPRGWTKESQHGARVMVQVPPLRREESEALLSDGSLTDADKSWLLEAVGDWPLALVLGSGLVAHEGGSGAQQERLRWVQPLITALLGCLRDTPAKDTFCLLAIFKRVDRRLLKTCIDSSESLFAGWASGVGAIAGRGCESGKSFLAGASERGAFPMAAGKRSRDTEDLPTRSVGQSIE